MQLKHYMRLLILIIAIIIGLGDGDPLFGYAHATTIGSIELEDDGLLLEPSAAVTPRRQQEKSGEAPSVDLRQFRKFGAARRGDEFGIGLFD